MNVPDREGPDYQVLMLTPNGRDATLTQSLLEDVGVGVSICRDIEDLVLEVANGVGCLLVAEESITLENRQCLTDLVSRQPPWSDLPVLILTRPGANSATVTAALGSLGNVTVLERPVRVAALVSAVRVALRARSRQYELRGRVESQALLAAIVASSDDAIISKDLDGIITSWNAGAERLFGYTAQEVVGKPITVLMRPDHLHEALDILRRIRQGERIEHHETVRVRKDGTLLHVSLSISPLTGADGTIVGASKIARDITEKKQAEEVLKEADRRKDEFLATLAHELRNPLAPIRNSLHVLELTGNADPAVEYVREMMERQVNHMVRMVDDLMEVSRITRGKIELKKGRVDLEAVIRSAIETSQPLLDGAGHRLDLVIPPEPLILEADPVRLAQVFANLLNNAAKYTERPSTIRVIVTRDGGAVAVRVRDSGIGIPPEMLPRVFDMFTQIDASRRRSQGGLGIGLTLVRDLVQMHGGTVTAFSEGAGEGSEFVVRLPVEEGYPLERAVPRIAPAALHPLRVLVADDNHDAADSLGMLLNFLGANVHIAYDGPSALEGLEKFEPDLALLDIGMPGMDGYQVARRIREHPQFSDLKLIALTGWGQEEDRRRSQAAGFDHHLIKPTGLDAVRALLATVTHRERRRMVQT